MWLGLEKHKKTPFDNGSSSDDGAVWTNTSYPLLCLSFIPIFQYRQMVALDLDACLERLYKKQLLAECVLKELCERTKELLMTESNVVQISAPVTVVGDIHG